MQSTTDADMQTPAQLSSSTTTQPAQAVMTAPIMPLSSTSAVPLALAQPVASAIPAASPPASATVTATATAVPSIEHVPLSELAAGTYATQANVLMAASAAPTVSAVTLPLVESQQPSGNGTSSVTPVNDQSQPALTPSKPKRGRPRKGEEPRRSAKKAAKATPAAEPAVQLEPGTSSASAVPAAAFAASSVAAAIEAAAAVATAAPTGSEVTPASAPAISVPTTPASSTGARRLSSTGRRVRGPDKGKRASKRSFPAAAPTGNGGGEHSPMTPAATATTVTKEGEEGKQIGEVSAVQATIDAAVAQPAPASAAPAPAIEATTGAPPVTPSGKKSGEMKRGRSSGKKDAIPASKRARTMAGAKPAGQAASSESSSSSSTAPPAPPPPVDPFVPRDSIHAVSPNLTMDSLPAPYRTAPLPEINSRILTWVRRLSITLTKAATELGTSSSTMSLLMTNNYKHKIEHYSTLLRHYLWRTDQWAAARARQVVEAEEEQRKRMPTVPIIPSPTPEHSLMQDEKQEEQQHQAAREPSSSSAAAAVAVAASAATAAASLPSTAAAAAISDSASYTVPALPFSLVSLNIPIEVWVGYLDCTLDPLSQRDVIDEALWSDMAKIEATIVRKQEQIKEAAATRPVRHRMRLADMLDPADYIADGLMVDEVFHKPKTGRTLNSVSTGAKIKTPKAKAATKRKDKTASSAKRMKKKLKKEPGEGDEEDGDWKMGDESASESASELDAESSVPDSDVEAVHEKRAKSRRSSASGIRRPRIPTSSRLRADMAPPSYIITHSTSQLAQPTVFDKEMWSLAALQPPTIVSKIELFQQCTSVSADPIEFTSNNRPYALDPLQSVLVESPPTTKVNLNVCGGDAFIYTAAPISALAWAPVGGESLTVLQTRHFLAVALQHDKEFIRLDPSKHDSSCILLYSFDVDSSSAYAPASESGSAPASVSVSVSVSGSTPQLVCALRHSFGSCIGLRWYPHSLQQVDESHFSAHNEQHKRLGVLAAAFTDGTVQVRTIPIPTVEPNSDANQIPTYDFSSLPGVCLRPSSSSPVSSTSVTCLNWSQNPGSYLMAVGGSKGRICIFDLEAADDVHDGQKEPDIVIDLVDGIIIGGVCFHPLHPHLLSCCTFDGHIYIYDLRHASHPVLHSSVSTESYRCLTWVLSNVPDQDSLLVSVANTIKQMLLSQMASERDSQEKFRLSMQEWTAMRALPLSDSGMLADFSVGSRNDLMKPFVLATAHSDGMCCLMAMEGSMSPNDRHISAGLSITRRVHHADNPDQQSSLDISDSYPPRQWKGRGHINDVKIGVRGKRQDAELMKQFNVTATPMELATDPTLAIQAVSVNPNFCFPRLVASAGMAGIVRIQCVKSM